MNKNYSLIIDECNTATVICILLNLHNYRHRDLMSFVSPYVLSSYLFSYYGTR